MRIKIFILIFMMFAVLQSCVNDTEPKTEIIEITNAQGEVIETREIIIPQELFEMQEQTDKLVLYRTAGNDFYLNPAINIFREKYPHVEVIIENIPWTDDYYEYLVRLNTELAAGQGPDLLLMSNYGDLPDIYKMMSSGLFLDLNQIISQDSEFNISEYNQTVLDAGIFRGRRYVMPIDYLVPILMTTLEILDAEGISAEDLSTFEGFIKVVERYNAKYKDAPPVLPNTSEELQALFTGYKSVFRNWRNNTWQENQRDVRNLENFFPWTGIDLIDYAAGKVALDKAQFKSVIDIMTPFYANKIEDALDARGDAIITIGLREQQWLFHLIDHGEYLIYSVHEMLVNHSNLTPLYFPYPDINNGSTALIQKCALIPSASKNQINAYNLLKILLSEDMQSASSQITNKPVLISETRARADRGLKEYSEHPRVESSYEELRLRLGETADALAEMLINVTSAKLMPRIPYQDFLLQEMMPYWDGVRSFDDAYARLINKLEIYASE